MNYLCSYCLSLFFLLACSSKHKEVSIDPDLLSGKYYDNTGARDSIFIYADKSYKHKFYRKDGIVDSQTGTWYFKPEINDVFFENFRFYSDSESDEPSGVWPSHVIAGEKGEIKLQYSEDIYYVKVQ